MTSPKESSSGKRLLIVDDDKDLLLILQRYLESHDMQVFTAPNGSKAFSMIGEVKPDIIIADVDMPKMDGLTLCRKIKDSAILSSIPLIIISGKKISETDLMHGYTFGADDYIAKPFSYPLLLAKIKAILRRFGKTEKKEFYTFEELSINTKGRIVKIKEKVIRLTAKEFDLLTVLLANEGRVINISSLLETIWGYNTEDYNNFHTVEVHVSNLRKKIGSFSKHIISVQGHGYKWE